jgi:glucan 1,3-beta-glucosidase
MKQVFGNKRGKKLRGVNLGGWLVLEKWMTPSLFAGLKAEDETAWCVELGVEAESVLRQHWKTYIGRDDFAWLASIGINAVRIPVGHWLFGPDYPYHRSYGEISYPFVTSGVAVLDKAFDWAEEFGLLVVLDLHAAPGCQNGFDNGGIQGVCEWHTQPEYLDYSLVVLERLAERYRSRPALHAIEVLNEPRWDIETEILKRYTADGYRRIRQHCRAEDVAVVFHDGFRSYREYAGLLQGSGYGNVVFDIHRYQCFVQEDKDTDVYGHIRKAAIDWKNEADEIIQNSGRWTYVGEWSLGLDPNMMALWEQGAFDHEQPQMDSFQQNLAYRGYAAAQLASFEKYLGWFFWSYKTETMPHWSFRDCVELGWLPNNFA